MKIVVLGSGSKGNSTFIDFGTKKILIDVGFSYKQIKERLELIKVDPKEIIINKEEKETVVDAVEEVTTDAETVAEENVAETTESTEEVSSESTTTSTEEVEETTEA